MIYRIFPTQDTYITNAKRNNNSIATGSNVGESEILSVFKQIGLSGASGYAGSSSFARTIAKWDLSEISALTASSAAPTSGASYYLKLFNAKHYETQPVGYIVEVLPVSRSWDEGTGIDVERYFDYGTANWDKANNTTFWTTPGGDVISTNTASFYLTKGNEDLDVNITSIVNAWLTGGLVNHGLMVRLTSAEEADGNNYFTKKFHARNTSMFDKRPTIEMRWDDSVRDDRSVVVFDVTSSLYLYNKARGQLADITGIGTGNNVITVRINDLSGTIMTVSASHTGKTGIYSASFVLATSSYSGSLFTDYWGVSGRSFMTGTFTPHNDGASSANNQSNYIVSIKNLKKEYELNEQVRFNMFVRTRTYNPVVVQTASLAIGNTIIEKGYYRIDNASTGEAVIPLGTGSVETTRLSYDNNGNYFQLYMNSLARGNLYNIVFYFQVDGQLQRINQDFKFRVV